jgi:phospholipid/cholesterol/gamma-HCH transport system substrate-binding protein
MNQHLTRSQAIRLGFVVLLALGLGSFGLAALSNKQGLWVKSVELTVPFADVSELFPGTPVRLKGLEVGQVVELRFAEDPTSTMVQVRIKVQKQHAERLNADASAQIRSTGLLGGKVIELIPGDPKLGGLQGTVLQPGQPDSLSEATAKLANVSNKVDQLITKVESGQGTIGKLLNDETLYRELHGLAKDSRTMIQKAEGTVQKVEGQVNNVEKAVQDGRETARAAKTTIEGVNQSWLGRKLFDDASAILVRPRHRKEDVTYSTSDLFEPNTAILHEAGKAHLIEVTRWLKADHPSTADVVIVALCDPDDKSQSSSSAQTLTRQQAEVALEFLKAQGAHKIGWVSKRKFTALGLGQGPSPVVESRGLPASYLQVLLFTPQ